MKKNVRTRLVAASLGLLIAAAWCGAQTPATAPTASSPAPATARAVIESVTHDVLAVFRDSKLTKSERRQKIRAIAYANMDFDVLARLTLGRNWRDLTDARRTEFVAAFRQHLSATYSHTSDEYTDEDLVVGDDHAEARGDWTVQTRVLGTKDGVRKEIAKLEYRLRKKDDRWLIIDVTIDGVSLMANFRAQFQEILSNGGIDKLLKLLKEKNAATDQ